MSVSAVAVPKSIPNAPLNLERDPALTCVATYRRKIAASLARVWENVLDWEHLPWLHSRAFAEITCDEAGGWGWRADVLYPGGEQRSRIELLTHREAGRYVARVLTGPGSGGEIWTTLSGSGERETEIVVEFCMSVPSGMDADALGKGYLALYSGLWDEDEEMMQRRQRELDRAADRGAHAAASDAIDLGTLGEVHSRLPLDVDAFGARMRIVDLDGDWILHSLVCPHLLGPLDDCEVVDGEVTCPWHGYRFDLRTGGSCDGRRFRLALPARLEIDVDADRVRLRRSLVNSPG